MQKYFKIIVFCVLFPQMENFFAYLFEDAPLINWFNDSLTF